MNKCFGILMVIFCLFLLDGIQGQKIRASYVENTEKDSYDTTISLIAVGAAFLIAIIAFMLVIRSIIKKKNLKNANNNKEKKESDNRILI